MPHPVILIVDDEYARDFARCVRAMMNGHVQVITASDERSALLLLRHHHADLDLVCIDHEARNGTFVSVVQEAVRLGLPAEKLAAVSSNPDGQTALKAAGCGIALDKCHLAREVAQLFDGRSCH